MEDDDNHTSKPSVNEDSGSVNRFVSPGIILFLDQILVAAGSWLFWLVISKVVLAGEIGQATGVYSLVLLVSTVIQLGLEYPLLRRVSKDHAVFGAAIVLELIITAAAVPIVFIVGSLVYQDSLQLVLIALGILALSAANFIGRFALLGVSNSKVVLIIDIIGTAIKFIAGLSLVTFGFGALGILVAFLLQAGVTGISAVLVAGRLLGVNKPSSNLIRLVSRDALVNTPSKLSNILIVSLSVVLLAAMGISDTNVGIFYIAVMMTIVAGSFSSSLAFMSIPASSSTNSDLSHGSLRLSLVATSPVIAVLIVAPQFFLSLIGDAYVSASDSMIILAIGVLPSAVLVNTLSKLNNLNETRKLLGLGGVRLAAFIVPFFILVPMYDILGAAYAILLSVVISVILPLIWFRNMPKYVGIAVCSIAAAVLLGYGLKMFVLDHPLLTLPASMVMSLLISLLMKGTSISELKMIASMIQRR